MDYALALNQLRKNKGWSVRDAAEKVGVSPRTWEGWEQGRMPSKTALLLLSHIIWFLHLLQPYNREEITETFERSKGLIDGGIKLSFKLPESLGGAHFEFERKPIEETRKIKKEVFKPKE